MDIIIVEEIELCDPVTGIKYTEHQLIYTGSSPYIIQKHKNYVSLNIGGRGNYSSLHFGKLTVKSNVGIELYSYETDSTKLPQLLSLKTEGFEPFDLDAVRFIRKGKALFMIVQREGLTQEYLIADGGLSLTFVVEAEDGKLEMVEAIVENREYRTFKHTLCLNASHQPYPFPIDFRDLMSQFTQEEMTATIAAFNITRVVDRKMSSHTGSHEVTVTLQAVKIHDIKGRFIPGFTKDDLI